MKDKEEEKKETLISKMQKALTSPPSPSRGYACGVSKMRPPVPIEVSSEPSDSDDFLLWQIKRFRGRKMEKMIPITYLKMFHTTFSMICCNILKKYKAHCECYSNVKIFFL